MLQFVVLAHRTMDELHFDVGRVERAERDFGFDGSIGAEARDGHVGLDRQDLDAVVARSVATATATAAAPSALGCDTTMAAATTSSGASATIDPAMATTTTTASAAELSQY